MSYLNQKSNVVFVATHDLELADLLKDSFYLFHFTEIVQQDRVIFDYKLKGGPLTDTNAIRILELNNYPQEVIQEADQLARRMTTMILALGPAATANALDALQQGILFLGK